MAKKVFYDDDARKPVLGGAEILYNAVKTTMGPKGAKCGYQQNLWSTYCNSRRRNRC